MVLPKILLALTSLSLVSAHYIFPALVVNGQRTADWVNVRMTENHWSNGPVTDVKSADFRCYNSVLKSTAETINVAAGSTLGIATGPTAISHPGVVNVYMARAPGDAASFDGAGQVWFKVHQITAKTGGGTITFPADGLSTISFTVPKNLPSGQYLVRMESIALHGAGSAGGAQFYISCGQVNITGGGSGKPGPLVSIPGVYSGNEPGILINIYYPVPTSYTQPGPPVWTG